MEARYRIGERELEVSAPDEREWSLRGEGLVRVTIEGRERLVEVMESSAHHLDVIVDGRRLQVELARDRDGARLWVSLDGRARVVEALADGRAGRRRGRAAEGGPKLVTPAFPATVVKVLVTEGELVDAGQALVVVSAMKMEMTLAAPHAGVVSAVNTEEGQTVSPGDELVVVEAAGEQGEEGGDD